MKKRTHLSLSCAVLLAAALCACKVDGDGGPADGGASGELGPPGEAADLASPDLGGADLRTGCSGEATRAVGEACTRATACECSGPKSACLSFLDVGDGLDLPGGYCSNSGCTLNNNATCGTSGVCADLAGDGTPQCYRRCAKGQCRPDYACLTIVVDPNNSASPVRTACLPKEGIVECDPTADPLTQCTTINGFVVATLTNGAPNAACLRIGPDPAGQCSYVPCQIGPQNCPALDGGPFGCFYFDVQRNTQAPDPADTFKGPVCLPIGTQRSDGDACGGGFNTCGDNMYCDMGLCRQLCFNGAQRTYAGGVAAHKNPAAACPAGRTCQDVFLIGGAGWTGLCRP